MIKSRQKHFNYLEIVAFEPSWATKSVKGHPLTFGEHVLFLGNIPNASGHCAVAKRSGEVVWLVHPEDFRKLKDEEL